MCNENFASVKKLSVHFRYKHKLSSKQYYDYFLKKESEGSCSVCNSSTPFGNIARGYYQTCSKKCSNNSVDRLTKIVKSKKEKYGPDLLEIKQKQKNTVNNWSEEKRKQHSKDISLGVKRSRQQNPDIVRRTLATKNEKYNWSDKIKQAHEKRTVLQIEEANKKRKQTCLEKYGVECYARTKNFKQTHQQTIEKRSLEEKQKIIHKTLLTKIQKNIILPFDHPERLNKKRYKNKCRILSEHWAQIKFDPDDLIKRGLNGTAGALQLDHIVSLETCFKQGIPIEIAGHWVNLRLISWEENIKKKIFDGLTTNQLLENFQNFDHETLLFAISKGEKFK